MLFGLVNNGDHYQNASRIGTNQFMRLIIRLDVGVCDITFYKTHYLHISLQHLDQDTSQWSLFLTIGWISLYFMLGFLINFMQDRLDS